jgi:hypothetical protein
MPDEELFARTTCAALLITCSDFRFKSVERELAESCGLRDDYDLIARPGGVRSLVAPRSPAAGETMVEEIALLHRLHRFGRVLLVNHQSCRAYDDIASPANERAVHVDHLRGAASLLQERLTVQPEPYLLVLRGGALLAEPIGRV